MLDRLLVVSAALGLAVAIAQALPPVSLIPLSDMNASRVTPAIALAKGYGLYAGPDDGPVIDFMYGPLAAIAFLPVALASSPSGALLTAAVINLLAFFVPMAWLHLVGRTVPARLAAVSFVAFALLVPHDPGLSFSAFTIHVDAPALGLVACACALLLGRGSGARRLSAACAVLAVWTKQTTAPVALALPLYVLLVDGRRACRQYCSWLGAVGIAVSLLLVLLFGYRDMVFNMFTLPGHHPWYGEAEHGKAPAALNSLRLLVAQNRWPAALLAVLTVLSARGAKGLRPWLRQNPWTLPVLVGLMMVPTSVLGGAKVGGFLNTHSFTNYFVLGAATRGLGEVSAHAWPRARQVGTGVLVALLLLLIGAHLASAPSREALRAALARLHTWRANPQEQADAFARAHPGEVYFPWNPLASLQAEGRLYHSEIGTWNRELGGIEITKEHVRRYLPPRMRWVAFRPPTGALTWLPPATHHVPEFSARVSVPGLEGWDVYGRDRGGEVPEPEKH